MIECSPQIHSYKDDAGVLQTTVISVEEYNNNDSIDNAIAYSVVVKPNTSSDLAPKDTSDQLISFNNAAAYASDPGWTISASNSWVDSWTSVTI